MKIPKSFKLFGLTIKVVFAKGMLDRDDSVGLAFIKRSVIELCPTTEQAPISPSRVEQTFCHEWVHFMLDAIGERDLGRNEKFVSQFSGLLHQGLTTMEYEPEIEMETVVGEAPKKTVFGINVSYREYLKNGSERRSPNKTSDKKSAMRFYTFIDAETFLQQIRNFDSEIWPTAVIVELDEQ